MGFLYLSLLDIMLTSLFRSYLSAYASHSLRTCFDVNKLDLNKVAKSFGFKAPPRVDIQLGASMARDKKGPTSRKSYGAGAKRRKFD